MFFPFAKERRALEAPEIRFNLNKSSRFVVEKAAATMSLGG
jgi:hypothetical protein